jgi:hypothetical protein
MTKKLHVKLGPDAKDAAVSVKLDDGTLHRLDRVLSITLHATSNDQVPPTVSMVMWSPDFDAEIPVSEDLAKAILAADGQRTLGLFSEDDASALRALNAMLEHVEVPPAYVEVPGVLESGRSVLRRLIAELDRRYEVMF